MILKWGMIILALVTGVENISRVSEMNESDVVFIPVTCAEMILSNELYITYMAMIWEVHCIIWPLQQKVWELLFREYEYIM